jgi:hypothetical protein
MARLNKTSAVLETARQHLAGLKSFKNPPDFSPNLTVPSYEAKEKSVTARLDAYNQSLATSDQLQNEFMSEEEELKDLNRRFLSAGEAVDGPDSSEYEMLGGTRKSERTPNTKRRYRRLKPAGIVIQAPRFPVRWRPTRNLHRGSRGFYLFIIHGATYKGKATHNNIIWRVRASK